MKTAILLAAALTAITFPAFADGVGIGVGRESSGKIAFVTERGRTSQEALDKAREACLARLQECTPLAQIDEGCVTIVASSSPNAINFYRGNTPQEALRSCSVGGDTCTPPLASITECAK